MITLSARISGLENVVADIQGMPEGALRRVMAVIQRYAHLIEAEQLANVSGRVLNSRGELRNSIEVELWRDARYVSARVGTRFYLGRIWERGFNGRQHARGHLRAIRTGSRLEVVKLTRRGKVRRTKVYNTGATQVRAYDRQTDGRPRPWANPALERFREPFREEVRRALEGVLNG